MKKTTSIVLRLLVLVMVAVLTITCVSCALENGNAASVTTSTSGGATTPSPDGSGTTSPQDTVTRLGEGRVSFNFTVIFADKSEYVFLITTDKTNLEEALLEHELIAGETSSYGLMVTSVCGIEHKYADGKWWELRVDGKMSMVGASSVEITEGASYSFAVVDA